MDTITSIEKIDTIKESVVTIGNFDGLHRGHQVLIKKATEYAKANNISSVVFTFKNHPVNYFRPGSIKNIITSEEKIKILIISPITLAYLIVSYEFPSEAIAFAKWKAMLAASSSGN